MTRMIARLALGGFLAFLPGLTLADKGAPPPLPSGDLLPTAVYDSHYAQPIWVSSSVALDVHGVPKAVLFSESSLDEIEHLLKAETPAEGACIEQKAPVDITVHSSRSRDDVIREATSIFRARVVDTDTGFYFGQAGTLALLKPEDQLAGTAWNRDLLFVAPVAEFVLGDRRICSRSELFDAPPSKGDHLVVVLSPGWVRSDFSILQATSDHIFVVSPEGHVKRAGAVPTETSSYDEFSRWIDARRLDEVSR